MIGHLELYSLLHIWSQIICSYPWCIIQSFPHFVFRIISLGFSWRRNLHSLSYLFIHLLSELLYILCIDWAARFKWIFLKFIYLLREKFQNLFCLWCDKTYSSMKVVHRMKWVHFLAQNYKPYPLYIFLGCMMDIFKITFSRLQKDLIRLAKRFFSQLIHRGYWKKIGWLTLFHQISIYWIKSLRLGHLP